MSESSSRTLIEAVSKCLISKLRPTLKIIYSLVPQFAKMLEDESNECVKNEVCKAIVYLCVDDSPCIKAFIDIGIKTRLMHLLTHQSEVIVAAALRALRSLVLRAPSTNQDEVTSTEVVMTVASPPRNEEIKRNHFTIRTSNETKRIKQEETYEWLVLPLIDSTHQQAYVNLYDLDLITCQNVEMFKATIDDTDDREKEAGAAMVGQVGLRCIHCGVSPFARAQLSVVYPGEYQRMGCNVTYYSSSLLNTPSFLLSKAALVSWQLVCVTWQLNIFEIAKGCQLRLEEEYINSFLKI